MKTLLLVPPKGDLFQPPLGIASLTGYLKKKGHHVVQRDLNLEAIDYLLTPDNLSKILGEIKAYYEKNKKQLKKEETQKIKLCLKIGPTIVKNIKNARRFLKFCRKKDEHLLISSLDIIEYAFTIISTRYYPSQISLFDYSEFIHEAHSATQKITVCLQKPEKNIFYNYFKRFVKFELPKIRPDIIGISVTYCEQMISSMVLAKLIKEKHKNIKVVLGGSNITQLRNKISNAPFMFEYVDGYIIFDGESSFEKLLQKLEKKQRLESIPNFILYKEGKIIKNESSYKPIFPLPSFEGLPLKKYFGPRLFLPFLTSKGCGWARCSFCVMHKLHKGYKTQNTGKLVKHIKYLSKKYRTSYFMFNDLIVHPYFLRKIANSLLKANAAIYWSCCTRFEKSLNLELLSLIYKAGCRMLLLGLESGSQKILDKMNKGINVEDASKILKMCKKIGIRTLLFIFFGFPTETCNDAKKTKKFIEENKKYIDILAAEGVVFHLREDSEVFKNPVDYSIKINRKKKDDLCLKYSYTVRKGFSQARAHKFACSVKPPKSCKAYLPPFVQHFICSS